MGPSKGATMPLSLLEALPEYQRRLSTFLCISEMGQKARA